MKILLAVDQQDDPRVVSAYIADRFDRRDIEVDVLTVVEPADTTAAAGDGPAQVGDVIYHPRFSSPELLTARDLVVAIAQLLQSRHGISAVRPHVKQGAAVEQITECAERWQSNLVLVGEPRRKTLFAALRNTSVARALFETLDRPVELLRPYSGGPRSLFNVVVPLRADTLESFPYERLQQLPWMTGSRLHLVYVQPDGCDEGRIEASPAAMIDSMLNSECDAARARDRLRDIAAELAENLGDRVDVQTEIVVGPMPETVLESARRCYASMIVLCPVERSALRNFFKPVSLTDLAMTASSSVLLLREPRKRGRCEKFIFSPHGAPQSEP